MPFLVLESLCYLVSGNSFTNITSELQSLLSLLAHLCAGGLFLLDTEDLLPWTCIMFQCMKQDQPAIYCIHATMSQVLHLPRGSVLNQEFTYGVQAVILQP